MMGISLFLLTILSVSTHAAPAVRETSLTCPEVGPGDWANFFPNEDGKLGMFIIHTNHLLQTVVASTCAMLA